MFMKISEFSRSRQLVPVVAARMLLPGLALALVFWGGCGSGQDGSGGTSGSASPGAAASSESSGGSPLNTGPMAVKTVQYNPGLADWGAKLFEKHACITCHAFGEQKQGPDLTGVANRRTERWIRKQITDPEYMVKNDPIARELFAKFALQMANQHVPAADVDAILQFLVRESMDK